jgi:subtilisin-like proprotein convertase family protein
MTSRPLTRLLAVVATVAALGLTAAGPATGATPTPAPGCAPSTSSATQSQQQLIPTGPAVISSTLAVSGVGPYLSDLDVETSIGHTNPADLDITLTSPQGTSVTLTTDNGGSNDGIFTSTLWDDDADPGSQVPYANNPSIVTDRTYTNAAVATPLVPEEALAAFNSEDANGTWTLTISDDEAGDGGTLSGWVLHLETLPSAPTTLTLERSRTADVAIPAEGTATSTLHVQNVGSSLLDVDATTFLDHPTSQDLDVTLRSPAGTIVTLTTGNGQGNDDTFNGTVWDDDADPDGQAPYVFNTGLVTDQTFGFNTIAPTLVPEEAMGAFIGENPNGLWTLTVVDSDAPDGGTIGGFDLDLTTDTCGPSRSDARVRKGRTGPLQGDDIYGALQGQTVIGSERANRSVTFIVSAQNDAAFPDRLRMQGFPSTSDFRMQYFNPAGRNVTGGLNGGTYRTPVLAPGASHFVRAVVTVLPTAEHSQRQTFQVTANPLSRPTVRDRIQIIMIRR